MMELEKNDRVKMKYKPGQRSHLPWINDNIRTLMKQRHRALKMAVKNKVTHH